MAKACEASVQGTVQQVGAYVPITPSSGVLPDVPAQADRRQAAGHPQAAAKRLPVTKASRLWSLASQHLSSLPSKHE